MGLGDVLKEAAKLDLAGQKVLSFSGATKSTMKYTEEIKDGRFEIRLFSTVEGEEDVFIENSIPYDGSEMTENYARMYVLSMIFNAGLHGMKRLKKKEPKKGPEDVN
jgi:hypothetical protein